MQLKPDALGTIFFGHPAVPALIVTILTGFVIKHGISSYLLDGIIGRVFVKLGDYSYSIYLVHFPIIVLVNYVPFGGTRLAADSYHKSAYAVVLICIASAFSYFYIEKKISSTLNLLKFRVAIFIAIFISAFGLNAINLSQFNANERNIFSAWTDRDTYRCGKIFRVLNPTDIVCKVGGAKGNKSVLLIGNSHADSIKKVFSEKAVKYGFSTYFVVANDPLMNNGGPSAEQLVSEAVKRKIHVIVLHYSNYYENKKFRDELSTLVNFAHKKGIKVFIIAPVPTYDVHIPQAMFDNLENKDYFSLTKAMYLEKTQDFRKFVKEFNVLNVEVLDPSELLCPKEGNCLFSSTDFKPYYFDSNHLTLTGSSLLTPLFEKLFELI